MKKIISCSIFAVTFILSACTTYQYTARQTSVDRQNIAMTPTIVEVKPDYSTRIQVVSDWRDSKEDAMNECKYLAITTKKIDVVVDPIYQIEHKSVKGKYKATLVGFAGHYINSRTLYEDINLLKDLSRDDIEKYLILHNPEVLKYMNKQGEVVNIYHDSGKGKDKAESAPVVQEVQPSSQNNAKKGSQTKNGK